MKGKPYNKITGGLIAGWFVIALAASAMHAFETEPTRPPLPLLVAVVTPILIFSIWYWLSRGFREFVLALDPRTLTAVQAWRIAGFVFLVLYAYRILPGLFALPAGWGDIAIGASALLVAANLATAAHRTTFIFWQLLGIADLVTALGTGAAGQFIRPQDFTGASGIATSPMTVLPLSVIPVFAVPLFLILHIICIAQARRWPARELKPADGGLHSVAVHS